MFCARFFSRVVIVLIIVGGLANCQYYYASNGTVVPYPYQTALGLTPGQGPKTQKVGIDYIGGYFPYPAEENNLTSTTIPNTTQNFNNYYAMFAQQGRPTYQYPVGYPYPGIVYPQSGIGYPQSAYGYPQLGGYPPQGFGYPQPYQPSGVLSYGYPGMRYPFNGIPYAPPQRGQEIGQQNGYGLIPEMYPNIKTEIIDVSPEFHRKYLGVPSDGTFADGSVEGNTNQEAQKVQPKYDIIVDSQSSNYTNVPLNLTKPLVTTKKFTTSIRRTFVYDSSKPGEAKSINLHFINGEPITTTPPPTTTENEEVEGHKVTPKGRRFMDVPSSCPKGTLLAHNGKCIESFVSARLSVTKNVTSEITTQAPPSDENDI